MSPRIHVWMVCLALFLFAGLVSGADSSATNKAAGIPSRETSPEPVHPSWEQLMNGSLEGQYVEVSGMVGRIQNREDGWTVMILHTTSGELKTILLSSALRGGPLADEVRALVRLRGHLMVDRAPATQRVISGQIRMEDPQIIVDRLPPENMFAVPLQSAASLTRANPNYRPFSWVRVAGQIIHVSSRMFFMMDKGSGLRFITDDFPDLKPGDLVEVVGYQDVLSAAAPVLRGAVTHKTGHGPLPNPKTLSVTELVQPGFDSQWVRVDGVLTGLKKNDKDQILEMHLGDKRFWSRLSLKDGQLPSLRIGSELQLTGTYCAQGEYKVLGPDVAALDLLLNSPSGIKVLSTPPWWTLERLLILVGVLLSLLMATILWITLLHRKVEQRTVELATQIQERQRLEHLRAMEQERGRIARDLHDDLGSDITTVNMLVERAKLNKASDEQRGRYMDQLGEKAQAMVATLDEIVWAMNPRHDSLASLVGYLGSFAERFLALAGIKLRLDVPSQLPDKSVASNLRHQLFMVFKEALANVVHHASATEVGISVTLRDAELRCVIADNGRGLPSAGLGQNSSGLANMKERIEKQGGSFEATSAGGQGTTLRFKVPLN